MKRTTSSIPTSPVRGAFAAPSPLVAPPRAEDRVAGNGLLSRRYFIAASGLLAVAGGARGVADDKIPPSWRREGRTFSNYGTPAPQEQEAIRWMSGMPTSPGNGVSWTPLHALAGTITPNGLHFERHHNGIPDVDVDRYALSIHGKVAQPLAFSLDALHRYPHVSRQLFIECGGNSNAMWRPQPVQSQAGYIHGLVSCSEWTGVRVADLLAQTGLEDGAKWLVVDGLDAAGVTVSVPIDKALDDALLVMYQNGEAVRPENGYPLRLLLPGWEGILSVKWIANIEVSERPLMSRFDTVSYTDLMKDGTAHRFTYEMGVKSLITSPSPGYDLNEPGIYEIRGLAWSGAGNITRVEVSADGGQSWADAALADPILDKSMVRFRAPWEWQSGPAVLKSRATDSQGNVQPEREALVAAHGLNAYYHFNGIVAWAVDTDGVVTHVYA